MQYSRLLTGAIVLFACFQSMATHIRAGEIIARQVSGTLFSFTFIGYRDVDGINFQNGTFDFGDGTTYGGMGGELIPWVRFPEENGVERWEFTLTRNYSAGANYLVSYTEENRNADIQNISGSVNTAFHVETLIIIDPLFPNSSPFFTVPPIDQGVVGSVFEHNPGAFDPNNDSLSYSLVVPQQDGGIEVGGYLELNDASFYENPAAGNSAGTDRAMVSIDPANGTLIWDAPGGATFNGETNLEWNVAIKVQEWRIVDGFAEPLGYVIRDMQIIIWDFENEPPELQLPPDTCVIAGDIATAVVTATDPDNDPVKIEAFGGPFQVVPAATFSPDPAFFQAPPASLDFAWQTACDFVRGSPYQIEFKATDQPSVEGLDNPPGQSSFETWKLSIVGPAPEGLTVDGVNGAMSLSWDPYECSNAERMQIWRRVGEFEIDPTCNPGVPENSGYELIQTQDINDLNFLDTNDGVGLSPGSKYCYRLVAIFSHILGGTSIASEEACDSLIVDLPVITNVDILSTSETDGEIRVNWTPPYEIDMVDFPPTYNYELIRTSGLGPGGNFISLTTTGDTTFVDSDLNTLDSAYSYRVILYASADTDPIRVDTSQQASSVRLAPSPQVGGIRLSWEANVPWSNTVQDFPVHYIYRDRALRDFMDSLVLIDSVDVTLDGFSYLDDGIDPNEALGIVGEEMLNDELEYCYAIVTQGSYDNVLFPEPLLNRSQIVCAQPNDTIPPCAPIAISFDANPNLSCEVQFVCESNALALENVIEWQVDETSGCDDDIQFYRIYISDTENEADFFELGTTVRTRYIHNFEPQIGNPDPDIEDQEVLTSLAYCYYITAVDRSGNESVISDIICNDNCPQFVLPNVFTPNGDAWNNTFRPIRDNDQCPRFVEDIVLTIVNRAGREVFRYDTSETENSIDGLEWDGTTNGGIEVPAGVYYYSAEVRYVRLNPEDANQVVKGWVQLIR